MIGKNVTLVFLLELKSSSSFILLLLKNNSWYIQVQFQVHLIFSHLRIWENGTRSDNEVSGLRFENREKGVQKK